MAAAGGGAAAAWVGLAGMAAPRAALALLLSPPPPTHTHPHTYLQRGQQALHSGADAGLPRGRAQHRKALRRRVLGALAGFRVCGRGGGEGRGRAKRRLKDSAGWLAAASCPGRLGGSGHEEQGSGQGWQAGRVRRCVPPPVPAADSCASRLSAEAPAAALPTSAWKKDCSASRAAPAPGWVRGGALAEACVGGVEGGNTGVCGRGECRATGPGRRAGTRRHHAHHRPRRYHCPAMNQHPLCPPRRSGEPPPCSSGDLTRAMACGSTLSTTVPAQAGCSRSAVVAKPRERAVTSRSPSFTRADASSSAAARGVVGGGVVGGVGWGGVGWGGDCCLPCAGRGSAVRMPSGAGRAGRERRGAASRGTACGAMEARERGPTAQRDAAGAAHPTAAQRGPPCCHPWTPQPAAAAAAGRGVGRAAAWQQQASRGRHRGSASKARSVDSTCTRCPRQASQHAAQLPQRPDPLPAAFCRRHRCLTSRVVSAAWRSWRLALRRKLVSSASTAPSTDDRSAGGRCRGRGGGGGGRMHVHVCVCAGGEGS